MLKADYELPSIKSSHMFWFLKRDNFPSRLCHDKHTIRHTSCHSPTLTICHVHFDWHARRRWRCVELFYLHSSAKTAGKETIVWTDISIAGCKLYNKLISVLQTQWWQMLLIFNVFFYFLCNSSNVVHFCELKILFLLHCALGAMTNSITT